MPSDPDSRERRTDDPYDRARRDFDAMSLEDRTRFLVEATASTLARTVEEAGRHLARGIGELFGEARERRASAGGARRPGAAEPETAQRTAPPTGRQSAPDPDERPDSGSGKGADDPGE